MSCRIMVGREDGTLNEMAVFFCSTSGIAFGPTMQSREEAEAFLEYLKDDENNLKYLRTCVSYRPIIRTDYSDPRVYTSDELMDLYAAFGKTEEMSNE